MMNTDDNVEEEFITAPSQVTFDMFNTLNSLLDKQQIADKFFSSSKKRKEPPTVTHNHHNNKRRRNDDYLIDDVIEEPVPLPPNQQKLSFNDLLGVIMQDVGEDKDDEPVYQATNSIPNLLQEYAPQIPVIDSFTVSDMQVQDSIEALKDTIQFLKKENELLQLKLKATENMNHSAGILAEAEDIGILISAKKGCLANWNTLLMNKLGYESSDPIPEQWQEIVHPLYHELCAKKLSTMRNQKLTSWVIENVLLRKKQPDQYVLVKKAAIQFSYDPNTNLPLFAITRFHF